MKRKCEVKGKKSSEHYTGWMIGFGNYYSEWVDDGNVLHKHIITQAIIEREGGSLHFEEIKYVTLLDDNSQADN